MAPRLELVHAADESDDPAPPPDHPSERATTSSARKASRRKSSLAEDLRDALPKRAELPPGPSLLELVLVGTKAHTPNAVRAELGKWRRKHPEG